MADSQIWFTKIAQYSMHNYIVHIVVYIKYRVNTWTRIKIMLFIEPTKCNVSDRDIFNTKIN